jgi:hypothetical protein
VSCTWIGERGGPPQRIRFADWTGAATSGSVPGQLLGGMFWLNRNTFVGS